MRIRHLCVASAVMILVACGGKPTAPETPIPSGDQEGGGKARSTEDKSNY